MCFLYNPRKRGIILLKINQRRDSPMRNLLKSFNTLMTNTKVEMKMEGWPATVSFLGICGVIVTAILSFGGKDEGGDDDE